MEKNSLSDKKDDKDTKMLVLGGLMNKADPASKKVISTYSFAVSYKTNLEKMKAHGATELEACAKYLGFVVRDQDDKKLYQNKAILCDRMILKIESLFDILCDECNKEYRNQLEDVPLLKCRLCLQGSHNCDEMTAKAKALNELSEKGLLPSGSRWLCHECDKKNENDLKPPNNKVKKNATSGNTSEGQLEQIPEEGEQNGEDGYDEGDDENDRDSPRRNRENGKISEKSTKQGTICKDYTMRRCPHGLTGKRVHNGKVCPYKHPRRCRYFSSFGNDKKRGCKRGKDCNFFHPKLCRNSVTTRTCLNEECTFHHLKGTARKTVAQANGSKTIPQGRPPIPPQSQFRLRPKTQDFNIHRENWPSLGQDLEKMGSLNSINTAYPPTIDNPRARPQRLRKESTSEKELAFLEKLLENMKDGILSQMDSKMAELREQIPALIQQEARSRQPSGQGPPSTQMMLPPMQHPQPMPMGQPQTQIQLPLMANYQGSYY